MNGSCLCSQNHVNKSYNFISDFSYLFAVLPEISQTPKPDSFQYARRVYQENLEEFVRVLDLPISRPLTLPLMLFSASCHPSPMMDKLDSGSQRVTSSR